MGRRCWGLLLLVLLFECNTYVHKFMQDNMQSVQGNSRPPNTLSIGKFRLKIENGTSAGGVGILIKCN